jgi:hypothetical protein
MKQYEWKETSFGVKQLIGETNRFLVTVNNLSHNAVDVFVYDLAVSRFSPIHAESFSSLPIAEQHAIEQYHNLVVRDKIQVAIPEDSTHKEDNGFRDGVEAMVLALVDKVSHEDMMKAVDTALDAYSNSL